MKISIITPSYNQAEYIEKTIQSVLSQKGDFELEYMVMDGGSTDGTIEILRKYEKRLKWFSEKDKGQSDAINKGFKLATGDIIGWINSDDMYEPGAFQKVINFFANNPDKKWVYGRCRIIDEKGKEIRKLITLYKNIISRRFSYRLLLTENYISQMSVFFKKEIFNIIGYLDINSHLVMDYDYWLRIGKLYPAGVINELIAYFRWYTHSKSGSDYKRQLKEAYETACKHAGKARLPLFFHKLNCLKIEFIYNIAKIVKNITKRGRS